MGGRRYSKPLDASTNRKFKELASLCTVIVVGFSQDIWPRRFTEQAHFYLLPRFPIPATRYATMMVIGPIILLWVLLRYRAHVLVAQSPFEGFGAALAKMLIGPLGRKTVLVIESHGDFEQSLFLQRNILLKGPYRFLMRIAAGFGLKNADVLRAVSASTYQQLERWAPGKPIFQFATWTDLDLFLCLGESENSSNEDLILFAGSQTPLKGIHHLIGAFKKIANDYPKLNLVIVGHEEDRDYAANLKTTVRKAEIETRVQFTGKISQPELAELMKRARIFVLPSLAEGLPRVIGEAMATRTLVIASEVGGVPEMVEDTVNGLLFPPGDEAELANKLKWVFEHPQEAMEIGQRGRAFANRFFSTSGYLKGYKEIFEVVANKLDHS